MGNCFEIHKAIEAWCSLSDHHRNTRWWHKTVLEMQRRYLGGGQFPPELESLSKFI